MQISDNHMVVEDSNFDPKSSIDSCKYSKFSNNSNNFCKDLDQKLLIDPSYQIKSWREIAIQQGKLLRSLI